MIANVSSGKYHTKTMEIIKLFQINIFVPVTKFPFLTNFFYFAKEDPFGSLISLGDFSKKLTAKIGNFALRKKWREKTQIIKVAKSCHQVTWV